MNKSTQLSQPVVRVRLIDGEAWLDRGQGWKRTDIFDGTPPWQIREFCLNAGWGYENVTPCNSRGLWRRERGRWRWTWFPGGRWRDNRPYLPASV